MSLARTTTGRLVAMRITPSQVCAGLSNSFLQRGAPAVLALQSRSMGTKRAIGEGVEEEKVRPGERSQVMHGRGRGLPSREATKQRLAPRLLLSNVFRYPVQPQTTTSYARPFLTHFPSSRQGSDSVIDGVHQSSTDCIGSVSTLNACSSLAACVGAGHNP